LTKEAMPSSRFTLVLGVAGASIRESPALTERQASDNAFALSLRAESGDAVF
jgi:hypothetical protein